MSKMNLEANCFLRIGNHSLVSLLIVVFSLVVIAAPVAGQSVRSEIDLTLTDNYMMDIPVPPENVRVVEQYRIGEPIIRIVPAVPNVAAVYSNVDTFTGNAFSPAGQANTPAITRLMADDLTFSGTAPYSIGAFQFSMCNLNAAAVSARPRVRFYLNNAGTPGTNFTGFSFNPVSLAGSSCTLLFATVAPFSVTSSQIWAGMLFDNSTATATAAQVDLFGMGVYDPPGLGTSANQFYLTTAAPPAGGSYLVNNPGPGAITNLGAMVTANFGWEFRLSGTIASMNRTLNEYRPANTTAQWTVTTTGGSITGLAPANFTLTGTHTGASITSVVANNISPQSTSWTVNATLGNSAGTLTLNWANITALNTSLTNTLPFAGQTYIVMSPSAASASVSGRVVTSTGSGIKNAYVSLSDANGNIRTAKTGSFGYYRIDDVEVGGSYVLSVASKRFVFADPSRTITVTDELSGIDFVAEP